MLCDYGFSVYRDGNFRINPDFRIENFPFKYEISLLCLFTRPSFCFKSNYLVNICLKKIIRLIISCISPDKSGYPPNNFLISQ